MKKIFALMILVLLVAALAVPVFADDITLSVKIRIEGKTENLFYGEVSTNNKENFNVISLLKLAESSDSSLTISGLENGYVTSVNGVKAGQTEKGFDCYVVRINGEYVPYSTLSGVELKSGDEILVYYSDEFESGIIRDIIVDTDKIEQGYIRFTYEKPSQDGSYVTNEALAGATVKWYCDEVEFVYTTDGQGGIFIDKGALTSGEHRVVVDLYHSNGAPAILRLAPDYTVKVPVAIGDTTVVYICAAAAVISLGAAVLLSFSFRKRKV